MLIARPVMGMVQRRDAEYLVSLRRKGFKGKLCNTRLSGERMKGFAPDSRVLHSLPLKPLRRRETRYSASRR